MIYCMPYCNIRYILLIEHMIFAVIKAKLLILNFMESSNLKKKRS